MRHTSTRLAPVLGLAALLVLPALSYALPVAPGQTVIVNSTTLSPAYTGETLVDHTVTTRNVLVPFPGVTSYKQLTVQLVTNVYRNSGGTLSFAYNVSAQDFPQPTPGPPFMRASIPALNISNFADFATSANAENIPNAAPSGAVHPSILQVTRSLDGDDLQYLFATTTTNQIFNDNTLFPPQAEATTPAVVFVKTDATDYIPFNAGVEIHSYDNRSPSGFTTINLTFPSFSPIAVGVTPPIVPEPLSLATLPLAVGALTLKFRRR